MDEQEQIAYYLAKSQLRYFLPHVFYTLNPRTKFKDNWHLDYLAYELSRTLPVEPVEIMTGAPKICLNPTPNDRVLRLIINVPPRTLKSELVSVAYTTFLQGHFPHERVIAASYSGNLSSKLGEKSRGVVGAEWYREMFPQFKLKGKDNSTEYHTDLNGFRFCTSVGGTVTGEGANTLIGDDLLKPGDASSATVREEANEWATETFQKRLNDRDNGVIIMIMQRLHENDLTGHLMALNKGLPESLRWKLICLPAICEEEQEFEYYGEHKSWEKGELLHPTHLSEQALQGEKASNVYAYTGQFLQKPAPKGGYVIKLEKIGRYDTPGTPKRIIQSWDTSFKTGKTNDPSACATIYETGTTYDLADMFKKKMEYPELKQAVIEQAAIHNPHAIVIEDKASGQSLIQDLRRDTNLPIVAWSPGKLSKEERALQESATIASQTFRLPYYAHWLPDFEHELATFPAATHDDQVDSVVQGVAFCRKTDQVQFRVSTF